MKSSRESVASAPKTSLALIRKPAPQQSFEEWLRAVPSLQDVNGEEMTITIPITLSVWTWLDVAHVAAVHRDSLEEAVNTIVHNAATEDNFMNTPWNYRGEDREDAERRLQMAEALKP
jgi:hypothetical protein